MSKSLGGAALPRSQGWVNITSGCSTKQKVVFCRRTWMDKYWDERLLVRLNRANSYTELWWVARTILRRMPRPIVEVCGPISTGGLGSREENCRAFSLAITWLRKRGFSVFDQMPFQNQMARMMDAYKRQNGGQYDMRVLEEFYEPIFGSGMIGEGRFLPGWGDSVGATWERGKMVTLGIEVCEFPPDIFARIVTKVKRAKRRPLLSGTRSC